MAEVVENTVTRTVKEQQFTLWLSTEEFRCVLELLGQQGRGGALWRAYTAMAGARDSVGPDTGVNVGDRRGEAR